MKKRFNLLIIIGMYLLIYNPPLLGAGMVRAVGPFRNMIWVVAPVSIVYVLCNLRWLKDNLDWKAIVRTECILAAIVSYYLLVRCLNGNMTSILGEDAGIDAKHWIYWMGGDISFALAAWISLRKHGQDFSDLLDHLLVTGTVMAATVILAYLVTGVHAFFTRRMMDYGVTLAEEMSPFRNFGFAANFHGFLCAGCPGVYCAVPRSEGKENPVAVPVSRAGVFCKCEYPCRNFFHPLGNRSGAAFSVLHQGSQADPGIYRFRGLRGNRCAVRAEAAEIC